MTTEGQRISIFKSSPLMSDTQSSEHLGGVVAVMKLSDQYPDFIEKLNRVSPCYNDLQVPSEL
jgi:hypothetical protein